MIRIPGEKGKSMENRPPVFLQHGLSDCADTWMVHWPDVAPAFVVSRAGYDVWLGNSRGNIYSHRHTTLDPNSAEYWNFDWQEMGQYDLKAELDYVTSYTKYEKVAYIGHSQGTSQMFYGTAMFEDYFASKVNLFVALGPVTKIPHSKDFIPWTSKHIYFMTQWASEKFGVYHLGSDLKGQPWKTEAQFKFCKATGTLCLKLQDWIMNTDPLTEDTERFYVS